MASSARPLHLALRPASIRYILTTPTSCLRSRRISSISSYNTLRKSNLPKSQHAASIHTTTPLSTTTTPPTRAKVVPVYGTGPPPEPPIPPANPESSTPPTTDGTENLSTAAHATILRRRRQAALLSQARDIRKAASTKSDPIATRRFWKDVSVREVDGAYEVFLDSRALRRPDTKEIVRVPLSKPHLAEALAVEWDQLTSSREAGKGHLIPLTGLITRALDIEVDDKKKGGKGGRGEIREGITEVLLRYLDTDSLLCWAPPVDPNDPASPSSAVDDEGKSLRERQEEVAEKVVGFMTSKVWPGVSIVPVLDGDSIMPRKQAPGTREVVQGWILESLSAWELAGLERATLAGKSLLAGARLVVEWSEEGAGVVGEGEKRIFGMEECARASSVEVDWQIGRWGEVEDTHDVEKEDLRRQLGSVVLLVSGEGQGPLKAKI